MRFDAVHLRDVSRHYGRRRVLARATLSCRAGEIHGLFGPNGAGKSTLLGVVATLIRPSTGEVRYGDRAEAECGEDLRSAIGVLGHDLYLYEDLSARENLEFFGRLYGLTGLDARIDAALERARLASRAEDRVGSYSRGMRQRLALERSLLHEPQLVLLDEPFTGLDEESCRLLVERLQQLRAQGCIVMMATHDFDSAEGLVDSVVCLRDGRVRMLPGQAGSLRERYRQALAEAWD